METGSSSGAPHISRLSASDLCETRHPSTSSTSIELPPPTDTSNGSLLLAIQTPTITCPVEHCHTLPMWFRIALLTFCISLQGWLWQDLAQVPVIPCLLVWFIICQVMDDARLPIRSPAQIIPVMVCWKVFTVLVKDPVCLYGGICLILCALHNPAAARERFYTLRLLVEKLVTGSTQLEPNSAVQPNSDSAGIEQDTPGTNQQDDVIGPASAVGQELGLSRLQFQEIEPVASADRSEGIQISSEDSSEHQSNSRGAQTTSDAHPEDEGDEESNESHDDSCEDDEDPDEDHTEPNDDQDGIITTGIFADREGESNHDETGSGMGWTYRPENDDELDIIYVVKEFRGWQAESSDFVRNQIFNGDGNDVLRSRDMFGNSVGFDLAMAELCSFREYPMLQLRSEILQVASGRGSRSRQMSREEEVQLNSDCADYFSEKPLVLGPKPDCFVLREDEEVNVIDVKADRVQQWADYSDDGTYSIRFTLVKEDTKIRGDVPDKEYFPSCEYGRQALLALWEYQDEWSEEDKFRMFPEVPEWARPVHSPESIRRSFEATSHSRLQKPLPRLGVISDGCVTDSLVTDQHYGLLQNSQIRPPPGFENRIPHGYTPETCATNQQQRVPTVQVLPGFGHFAQEQANDMAKVMVGDERRRQANDRAPKAKVSRFFPRGT